MHQKKYAIRITEEHLPLIDLIHPLVEVRVNRKDTDRYFLFTIVSPMTTGDHDVVQGDDLENYDGIYRGHRTIIK